MSLIKIWHAVDFFQYVGHTSSDIESPVVGYRRTRRMSTNVFLCALFQLSLFLVISCGDDSVSVRLSGGQVLGRRETVDDKALNVFLGIPYAQPPVDRLRFQKPLPIESWSEPIEAVNWPRPCYQANHFLDNFRNQEFSEDCLYLNIWSPTDTNETAASEGRAVMFWIHGGALIIGSSVEKFYSGHVLAAKGDVVVVTINYRFVVKTFNCRKGSRHGQGSQQNSPIG